MYPSFTCSIALRTASRQLLFGRKPKLISLKSFSYSSLSTSATACWTNRSMTVGIPNGLCSPLSFGMYTRLIGKGRYSPCRIIAVSFPGFSKKYSFNSSVFMPSTPGEPLLACTFFMASHRFLPASILSSVIALKASLLMSSIQSAL